MNTPTIKLPSPIYFEVVNLTEQFDDKKINFKEALAEYTTLLHTSKFRPYRYELSVADFERVLVGFTDIKEVETDPYGYYVTGRLNGEVGYVYYDHQNNNEVSFISGDKFNMIMNMHEDEVSVYMDRYQADELTSLDNGLLGAMAVKRNNEVNLDYGE